MLPIKNYQSNPFCRVTEITNSVILIICTCNCKYPKYVRINRYIKWNDNEVPNVTHYANILKKIYIFIVFHWHYSFPLILTLVKRDFLMLVLVWKMLSKIPHLQQTLQLLSLFNTDRELLALTTHCFVCHLKLLTTLSCVSKMCIRQVIWRALYVCLYGVAVVMATD